MQEDEKNRDFFLLDKRESVCLSQPNEIELPILKKIDLKKVFPNENSAEIIQLSKIVNEFPENNVPTLELKDNIERPKIKKKTLLILTIRMIY